MPEGFDSWQTLRRLSLSILVCHHPACQYNFLWQLWHLSKPPWNPGDCSSFDCQSTLSSQSCNLLALSGKQLTAGDLYVWLLHNWRHYLAAWVIFRWVECSKVFQEDYQCRDQGSLQLIWYREDYICHLTPVWGKNWPSPLNWDNSSPVAENIFSPSSEW